MVKLEFLSIKQIVFISEHQQQQQNVNRNNTQEPRWRNNGNYQSTQPRPEPMEINNAENFQQVASTESYHI